MRPPSEIEADDDAPPPRPDAGVAAWEAWRDRLAPGEHEDLLAWIWLAGIAGASSGLEVPERIAGDPRLTSRARVVLAALETAPDASAIDCVAFATRRIFGAEDSDFASLVRLALADLEEVGALTRTRAGGYVL